MQNYWYNGIWCYGDVMFQTMNIQLHLQNGISRNYYYVINIFVTMTVLLS